MNVLEAAKYDIEQDPFLSDAENKAFLIGAESAHDFEIGCDNLEIRKQAIFSLDKPDDTWQLKAFAKGIRFAHHFVESNFFA